MGGEGLGEVVRSWSLQRRCCYLQTAASLLVMSCLCRRNRMMRGVLRGGRGSLCMVFGRSSLNVCLLNLQLPARVCGGKLMSPLVPMYSALKRSSPVKLEVISRPYAYCI